MVLMYLHLLDPEDLPLMNYPLSMDWFKGKSTGNPSFFSTKYDPRITWWFGTMEFYDFPFSWEWKIIPTDFHSIIFQRGRYTTNQINYPLVIH